MFSLLVGEPTDGELAVHLVLFLIQDEFFVDWLVSQSIQSYIAHALGPLCQYEDFAEMMHNLAITIQDDFHIETSTR